MCEEYQWWVLLFVADAVFGEVLVSLYVAGAVFGEIGMIAGARNVVFFNKKCSWWAWKITSVARRVADGRFHARIMVGSWSDHSRIMVGSAAHWKWRFIRFQQISLRFWTVIFRGRRSIWWVWTMTHVAPRIVNNVSFVSRINHEIHFSWQAQYLVS